MIRKILASIFAPLQIALATLIFVAYQVHYSDWHRRRAVKLRAPPIQAGAAAVPAPASTPGLNGPEVRAPTELSSTPITGLPATTTVPAKRPEETQKEIVLKAPSGAAAMAPGTGKPRAMTMLSISCYGESEMMSAQTLTIRCRTFGSLSNATGGDHVMVKGVVTEDVISATGKILIPAGSKVAGIGHVDPDNGRLKSQGNWSILTGDYELRVQAEMKDADAGFPGIAGKETSSESELSQRQAIVRDGRYCFLSDKTPFVLSIKGEVSFKDFKTLKCPE